MKRMKGDKQKKVVEINFDAINGVLPSGSHCELEYNRVSKRYVLRTGADQGGDFSYSHVSLTACKNKAADMGIVWR